MAFYMSPGVYTKEKDLSNIVPNIATTSAALVGASNKGSTSVQLITTPQQFVEEYGEPVVGGSFFHLTGLAFLENGNTLYCKRVTNGALYSGVKIMATGGTNIAISAGASTPTFQAVSGVDIAFYIYSANPGTWGNDIGVQITNLDAADYEFDIDVYMKDSDGVYAQVESFTVSRKTKTDGNGRQMYLETKINGYSKYILVADSDMADTVMPVEQTSTLAFAQGSNGTTVTDSDVVNGWDLFINPEEYDIRILLNGGYTSTTVQTKMKAVAEARKDCIAILDVPYASVSSPTNTVNWRNVTQNFNSSYTAVFAPWVKINDNFNDIIVEIPPSGYIGSMLAYNDAVADAWYAAAGFNRGILNILGLTDVYTQGERDVLYTAGINPLQKFSGAGYVIWGQKTQQKKSSALDRINVRRLLIVIEKALSISLQAFVFEPNSDLTRFRVSAMCEEYLGKLASRGAFQTELGDRGYRVVCDTSNNTPSVIDANELHVDVFVKPIRMAEMIQLQVVVTTTGTSFEELIARGSLIG